MRVPFLFIAVVFSLVSVAFAQNPVIDITTATAPVNVLTIQDVDFVHATTPKWLFTINLTSRAGATIAVNATMRIVLDVTMSTGETFPSMFVYETVPFDVRGSRSFTNLDLTGSAITKSYVVDDPAKRRLEQLALPTGVVPAGVYTFSIAVETPRYQQTARAKFSFVLSNPSRVDLVFPLDKDRGVGEFPLFQWTFDGPQSRISIFEALPNQASLEEATNGVPHVKTEVAGTSFLYPSAGVRPLEPGKTYVWFVEGLVGSTGGPGSSIKSKLRSFTVAAGGTNVALQSLLDDLEKALGPAHKATFDRIREGLLSPTGQLTLDGKSITVNELIELINKFRANPDNVIATDLE